MATGWLGWSDADALNTPIPRILLAVEGRTEWARMTNPFGGGKEDPVEDAGIDGIALTRNGAADLSNWRKPSSESLGARLRGALGRRRK